ncbi:putative mitochondrial hypothetical protein [Leptomonas pyrrhocoris]|uniref:Uncharacterized protein n=1 Tax=Leptomonas pyrrhocoris TaxID=157538 RepID=A0A0M9FU80_LEPPY|nr:putative mitochondrial hypothetical protein [Leptomonas pyrrhocoris]XP_015654629.1 putative mitochondrial hypothetical protein [Leptomonas pyrrhocoris]KPA76189.1 putative mitochondrial hypothetical protein [Leptomonas pyrrhocoris]KPA76190.1 putative mitochondrial hypothetical protein [Leptomonas pyrrhocoris]|eukprot:XP_015654628.1 putative mitochondrial hypothetical protein [Leptomonas pyrrhocoris]
MPPRTVLDLVRSHIHLPINRDYTALKRVLRDWHQYSTQVPVQDKPTFPAELLITITRTPLSSPNSGTKRNAEKSPLSSQLLKTSPNKNNSGSTSLTTRSRRWSLWKSRSAAPTLTREDFVVGSGAATSAGTPLVYRKVVPLHVWTAVLPWEMQRGLSFSDLTLPSFLRSEGKRRTIFHENQGENQQEEEAETGRMRGSRSSRCAAEEEDDPYGVVTPLVATTSPRTPSTLTSTTRPSNTSITAAVPAMLFLSDIPSTKAYGVGFWSGAIRQPIDVLFVAPTLPASVGPAAASFQQLREQDAQAAAEDNYVSRQVLHRFFPLREMRPPAAAGASSVTFRVHSFSHLDPLPPTLHPSRLDTPEGRGAPGLSFTATPDAPYNSLKEAPRYVLEVPRHTLQPAVAAALQESRDLFLDAQTGPTARWERERSDVDQEEVSIDLVVSFSDALCSDVFAKAQLCVEYVSLLEDAIAYYARELNTDPSATAVAADPLEGGGGAASVDDAKEKPIKVWLSEHESRWMTPAELRKASQSSASVDEKKGEQEDRGEEEKRAYVVACQSAAEVRSSNEPYADEDGAAYSVTTNINTANTADDTAASASSNATVSAGRAVAAAQAVSATPAQPNAVSAARSISLQSPMLQDETEGRPSYLAPSFVGRHESSVLRSSAIVLSADALARYPKTHSHMPQLPPVDYELFDLCMRLGVGQQAILYHYHERILRDWRAELQQRQQRRRGVAAANDHDDASANVAVASAIDPADVQRMVTLVRDRSLQLSPELVSLVEAVAAA